MAATGCLELAPATAESFALLLERTHRSFCTLLANSANEVEAMHYTASLVRRQRTLQGLTPDAAAELGMA